jgi:glutathione peroxidase
VNVHSFSVQSASGEQVQLSDYAGQVLLLVNVASKCGLTPQYEGLEELQRELGSDGLQVLGFPCNQFGEQEPGSDAEIQEFCSVNYSVSFPVFAKLEVNGEDADPLYKYLRSADPGTFGPEDRPYAHVAKTYPELIDTDAIKWNFTKFLVGRDGAVIKRIEPGVAPADFRDEVVAVLS